jgi:hypothetical protein
MDEEWSVHEPTPGDYRFDPLSYRVIGAATEVHRRLGTGFREELYENALCIEFDKRGIRYRRQDGRYRLPFTTTARRSACMGSTSSLRALLSLS